MGGEQSKSNKSTKKNRKLKPDLSRNVCFPNDADGRPHDTTSTCANANDYRSLSNRPSVQNSTSEANCSVNKSANGHVFGHVYPSLSSRPRRSNEPEPETSQLASCSSPAPGKPSLEVSGNADKGVYSLYDDRTQSTYRVKRIDVNYRTENMLNDELKAKLKERSQYAPSAPVMEYDGRDPRPPLHWNSNLGQNGNQRSDFGQDLLDFRRVGPVRVGAGSSNGVLHYSHENQTAKNSGKPDEKKAQNSPKNSEKQDARSRRTKSSKGPGNGDEPPTYEETEMQSERRNEQVMKRNTAAGEKVQVVKNLQIRNLQILKETTDKIQRKVANTENGTKKVEELNDLIKKEFGSIGGAIHTLANVDMTEKPFPGRNRLFIRNLPPNTSRHDLEKLISPYSEITVDFIDKDKQICCVRLKHQLENAQRNLNGFVFKGRSLRVYFDNRNVRFSVLNLPSGVTNELLKKAFSIFGEVERAEVLVDGEGCLTGKGYLEFAHKNGGVMAYEACKHSCFALTASLRPVILEKVNSNCGSRGYSEAQLPRNNPGYLKDRAVGPRFAVEGTVEFTCALLWKELVEKRRVHQEELAEKLRTEEDKIRAQIKTVRKAHEIRSNTRRSQ